MQSMQRQAETPVSADALWQVMADLEHWPDWTPSMLEVRLLPPVAAGNAGAVPQAGAAPQAGVAPPGGGAPPAGVGSRVRIRQPRLLPGIWTITRWQPGWGFEWAMQSPGLQCIGRHDIEPLPDGRNRVTLALYFTGPLSGPVALLGRRLILRYIDQEMAGLLRRAAEVS